METVEVVIRIPKEIIDHVNKFGTIFYNEYISYIADELRTATVLPKGHGRLIDNNKIRFVDEEFADGRTYMIAHVSDIDNSPTVIEADKRCRIENR